MCVWALDFVSTLLPHSALTFFLLRQYYKINGFFYANDLVVLVYIWFTFTLFYTHFTYHFTLVFIVLALLNTHLSLSIGIIPYH